MRKLGTKRKGKYNDSFKSIFWGVIGLIVAYYMINSTISFMGWILLGLSCLMFVLAIWQAVKANKN